MKKLILKRVTSAVFAIGLILVLCSGCGSTGSTTDDTSSTGSSNTASSADDTVYTLRVHHHDPQDSAVGQFLENWKSEVEEASDGRLNIEIYHGATLGSANETISMVLNGTCDIGWGGQSNFDGEFPLSEVITLPMRGITSSMQGTQVFWQLYEDFEEMQEEYSQYKVLLVSVGCANGISTKDTVISSVDDIKGMNIRINSGPINDFFQSLGASPVSVAMGEVYQAIDNNTIDAITSDWHGIYSFSLYEILNQYLNLNIMVGNQFMLMNLDSYNSLPEDLQAIIDEHSGANLASYAGEYWDNVTELCMDKIAENGGNVYTLDETETARFQEAADAISTQWVEQAEQNGSPGQDIYDRMIELIPEFAD